jgi:hypothetical protein
MLEWNLYIIYCSMSYSVTRLSQLYASFHTEYHYILNDVLGWRFCCQQTTLVHVILCVLCIALTKQIQHLLKLKRKETD